MANKQLEKLKLKIPYRANVFNTEENYTAVLMSLLEDAKTIALSTLYPFLDDFEMVTLPTKYYNWQIRASVELYKWTGNQGIKSYAENGLSWSRDTDGAISTSLLEEIVPKAGVPKRSEK